MTRLLDTFYNACNPLKAATKEQYVDSDEARGSRDLVLQFQNEIAKIKNNFLCFLFTGHTGCGKSSELQYLADSLEAPSGSSQASKRYLPVLMNADQFIEESDASPTDILLAILAQAAEVLKEHGIILQDNFLIRRLRGLKEFFGRDINLDDVEIPLWRITAKFKALKRDTTSRQMARDAMGKNMTSLREEIALQFERARTELKKKKQYDDFVLILDNLEKIERVQGKAEGYESHRELFIERSSQLTGLGAHVVYTVPLPLALANGSELESKYGCTPNILPMIKVEQRGHHEKFQKYETGWKTLERLVQRRIGSSVAIDDLIDRKGLEFLIRYSGGHTRQLMMFLKQASTLVDKEPITLEAAQRSIAGTVEMFSNALKRHLRKLAELELSPDQSVNSSDEDIRELLRQNMILAYRNAGSAEDSFNRPAPWYAVHPIIRELNPFKAAVEELKRKQKTE